MPRPGAFRLRTAGLLLLAAAVAPACEGEAAPEGPLASPVDFDTGTVRIEAPPDTFQLEVEIAERDEQRTHGLMDRPHLPEDAGMIFLFPEVRDPDRGFYMFRTLIPLDIAFLDGEGRIVAIETMEPCPSPNPRFCPTYAPGVPYTAALEVNRGYFAERGIETGHRVILER